MSIKENPRMKEDVTQILRFAKSRRRNDGENTGRYILSILYLHVYISSNLYVTHITYIYIYLWNVFDR